MTVHNEQTNHAILLVMQYVTQDRESGQLPFLESQASGLVSSSSSPFFFFFWDIMRAIIVRVFPRPMSSARGNRACIKLPLALHTRAAGELGAQVVVTPLLSSEISRLLCPLVDNSETTLKTPAQTTSQNKQCVILKIKDLKTRLGISMCCGVNYPEFLRRASESLSRAARPAPSSGGAAEAPGHGRKT